MKINEIIREKRLELGYTQEQLAKYLNLTAPAVNKWERGTGYPDITILPALARILKTDLNTLLSFKDDLSDYEVALFINELAKIKDFKQAYDQALTKINEYPTCYNLILSVASVLKGMLAVSKLDNSSEYEQEITALIERALLSDDLEINNRARVLLISKYLKDHKYDEAKDLINELPESNVVDKKEQMIKLYIAQEHFDLAAKLQEEALLSLANKISLMLITLMEIAIKENRDKDAIEIANVYKTICKSLDLWEYSSYLAHFQLYVTKKNRLKCLKILVPMLKSITTKWEINNSPLYRHIQTKEISSNFNLEMKTMIIDSLKNDQETSFLQDADFEKVLKEI